MDGFYAFIAILWVAGVVVGIVLWAKGSGRKDKWMTIFGSYLCLSILGVIITAIVTSSWDKQPYDGSYQNTNGFAQQPFSNIFTKPQQSVQEPEKPSTEPKEDKEEKDNKK